MATYVNDLRLKEITTGAESGTWGTSTNTNLSLIGEALSYATQESFSSDADATTTVADGAADPARAFYFKVTSSGSLTATRTLTMAPNTVSRIQIIENATSGSQIITISQGSGASVNIPNGETRMVYMDGAGAGAAVVDALADINIGGKVTVGVDDTGYDVTLFGATSGQKVFWDESADTLYQTCTVDIDGSVTVGENDTGYDVKLFGATSGAYMLWDESADDLKLVGAAGLTVAGDIDIGGTANLDVVDIDGATQADGTITVGENDTGYDVKFFGATSGAYMLWDESADDLVLAGAAGLDIAGDIDVDGTTNLDAVDIDGAVQLDSTFTVGENDTGYDVKFFGATSGAYMLWDESADDLKLVGAAGLTVAGDADIDGTLETDNLTIGDSQGSDGQVLTSTGSGVGWEDASGASDIDGLSDAKTFGTSSIMLGDATTGTINGANYNTGLGVDVFEVLTTGYNNTAVGYQALDSNTTGNHNVGIGYAAGGGITTGDKNIAIGQDTMAGATVTGEANIAVGQRALQAVTSGGANVAIGQDALYLNTTAGDNTAVGNLAMDANTTGAKNVGVGVNALGANTTASYNTAVGHGALGANTEGASGTAVGFDALKAVTDGGENTAVGRSAGEALTTGLRNVAIGGYALNSCSTQHYNVAVGYTALQANTAAHNTAVGAGAGTSVTSGDRQVAVGHNALSSCTNGWANTAVGWDAGSVIDDGDGNVCIGYETETSAAGSNNQIVMGDSVTGNADDSLCFGKDSTDSAIAFGATSITAPSDVRLKEDIQDEVVGLDFINELRPVTFRWKKAKDVPSDLKVHSDSEERVMNGKYNHGFISQEVKEVIDNNPDIKEGFDMWTEDEADGRQRIGESALIPMLVKSVQELSAEVEELKAKLEE